MKNKGYMTIEMSLVLPVILIIIFLMMIGLLAAYEKETLRANSYAELYSVPLGIVRKKKVGEYLNSLERRNVCVFGESDVTSSYTFYKGTSDGVISDRTGQDHIKTSHEMGVRTSRLRRWQFYDSLADD